MTYARNIRTVALAVAFVVTAVSGTDVTVVDSGVDQAVKAAKSADSSHRDGARSGFAGAKYVEHVYGVVVFADTEAQVADVRFAVARFAEYGLELTEVEVRYFSDGDRCTSADGRTRAGYLAFGNGSYVVYNCGTVFTLLHELAHVWDVQSLDDETREAFLAARGLDSWTHEEWAHAGGEHFADVLAWGLQDGNVRPSRTTPNDDESLSQAFEIATE